MLHPCLTPSIGADLRALRKARSLTLAELADHLGRSVGWLSQVERGLSEPTPEDLEEIARALDVSVGSLVVQDAAPTREEGYIVRADARRPIGSRERGLVEELLSPDLTDDFEVLHSTFEPGAALSTRKTRPTQEVAYVVSGVLDVEIAGTKHTVHPGDSFRIKGEPYSWANPYDVPCVTIWVIAPPVY